MLSSRSRRADFGESADDLGARRAGEADWRAVLGSRGGGGHDAAFYHARPHPSNADELVAAVLRHPPNTSFVCAAHAHESGALRDFLEVGRADVGHHRAHAAHDLGHRAVDRIRGRASRPSCPRRRDNERRRRNVSSSRSPTTCRRTSCRRGPSRRRAPRSGFRRRIRRGRRACRPSMTKSAPAPYALAMSPGAEQPPSAQTWPLSPCAASAHSMIAESCG